MAKAKQIGYELGCVYNLGTFHCAKDNTLTLVVDKENVKKVEASHLLPCYRKQFNELRRDGKRHITLGKLMGSGASRYVVQHPTNKTLVVKIDFHTYSASRRADSNLQNQNSQEFEAYKKLVVTGNKGLIGLLMPMPMATSNAFMVTQKRVNGTTANNYYHRSREIGSEARDRFQKETRKEFGMRFSGCGYDFHDENIMVNKKGQPKIVDLGFVTKIPDPVKPKPNMIVMEGGLLVIKQRLAQGDIQF